MTRADRIMAPPRQTTVRHEKRGCHMAFPFFRATGEPPIPLGRPWKPRDLIADRNQGAADALFTRLARP